MDVSILTPMSLVDAAGRSLGAVISKFKMLKYVGHTTFKVMYEAGIKMVYEYNSDVWGYVKPNNIDMVQIKLGDIFLVSTDLHQQLVLLAIWFG